MALFQRIAHTIRVWCTIRVWLVVSRWRVLWGRPRQPTDNQDTKISLDKNTLRSLQSLAEQEQCTPEEIANQILDDALRNHQAQKENLQRWEALTPREQEITALICLNYTSREVADKLGISPETVKTHVEHILIKFGVPDRNLMRQMFNGWDFRTWDR